MLLHIVIPSFKRPHKLRSTIQALLPQLTDDISITILDNASDPPITHETIGCSSAAEVEKMSIIRNPFNIGGDANILRCFEVCQAPYLWLLGDDDVLHPGAVSCILAHISAHPSVAFFNYKYTSVRESDIHVTGLSAFADAIDSWGDVLFISNSVWKVAEFQPNVHVGYKYVYACAGQVAVLLESLKENMVTVMLCASRIILRNQSSEEAERWSLCSFALTRFALLDMSLSSDVRLRLGRKMLEQTDALNHVFVGSVIMAASGRRQEASYRYVEITRRTSRYAGLPYAVRAMCLRQMLRFPKLSLFLLRRLVGREKLSKVAAWEQLAF